MENKLRLHPKTSFKRKKQLEQDLEHITQEMYRKNLELVETNRTLSLLRTIDNLVLGSQDSLELLCQQICMAIANNSDYSFVAIFAKPPRSEAHLDMLGWSAAGNFVISDKKPMSGAFLSSEERFLKSKTTNLLIRVDEITDHHLAHLLHSKPEEVSALREQLPISHIYVVKLLARQKLVGLMVVGLPPAAHTLSHDSQVLLERLSEAVGVALDNRLLYEENQNIVSELRKTNNKLRELDQTKDDFISMASHQLRTPLTSVKGYVSMVLEGDVGKVSEQQRKLLDQAYVSSQRMVYLIADLLNVSRLKTGKFIIESKPTNLADVIEGELAQLTETAASRKLEIKYQKPAKFPEIMLDETKIRQVIMNFVDNAIYYTPAGGHIEVKLEDKGDSIEFTVTDDGIGVPKTEQHNLFNKFFRAGNAKKARPDGTGLGLFMAKKVVVAQEGAIIFHSEEGKGSTFGFSFHKGKTKAAPLQR